VVLVDWYMHRRKYANVCIFGVPQP
jgi:hypothetical protein